ncbi:Putative ribonuclease H-like superfamily [Septoria linicola]|uniref:Ribonuclease H-like superfamily n=1 Tax=Septoria linicola TaxID=215465 RepID=A0A9Q9B186_9PEZI|nr:Putative ribonuclease H-like superfamily [Septoria linicola]
MARVPRRGDQTFVEWERRLSAAARFKSHRMTGLAALQAFVTALAYDGQGLGSDSDFVFASIDIEGDVVKRRGVKSIGVATFDTRACFRSDTSPPLAQDIETSQVAIYNAKANLWGPTTFVEPEKLLDSFAATLRIPDGNRSASDRSAPLRKLVLVGHGIHMDILTLAKLGLNIQDLDTVVGIIDTRRLAQSVLGRKTNVQHLVSLMGIPWSNGSFHGAANDAHYTLRAALALGILEHRKQAEGHSSDDGSYGILDEVIRQPVPECKRQDGDEEMDDSASDSEARKCEQEM